MYSSRIPAGIPTPLEDHVDDTIDLNELMVKDPDSTYLVRVSGDSMVDAGIKEDDVLVVDLRVRKRYSATPAVRVEVWPVGEPLGQKAAVTAMEAAA